MEHINSTETAKRFFDLVVYSLQKYRSILKEEQGLDADELAAKPLYKSSSILNIAMKMQSKPEPQYTDCINLCYLLTKSGLDLTVCLYAPHYDLASDVTDVTTINFFGGLE